MAKPTIPRPTTADMLRYTPAEWKAMHSRVALPADPSDPDDFDVSKAELEAALAKRKARRDPQSPAPRTLEQQLADDADARAYERAMRGR